MTSTSRRGFLAHASGAGFLLVAGCANGLGSRGGPAIDARVDTTLDFLYSKYPGTWELAQKAAGILVMPLVTEAGFGLGGSYGRGALRVGESTIDYYSATQASFGFQLGAQQYAHVLFFMTDAALSAFRTSPGWVAGADLKYAISSQGNRFSADTITATTPVVAVVFGQAGLLIGASLEGTKYTRIIA